MRKIGAGEPQVRPVLPGIWIFLYYTQNSTKMSLSKQPQSLQKYCHSWEKEKAFKGWLAPCPTEDTAFCKCCIKKIEVGQGRHCLGSMPNTFTFSVHSSRREPVCIQDCCVRDI